MHTEKIKSYSDSRSIEKVLNNKHCQLLKRWTPLKMAFISYSAPNIDLKLQNEAMRTQIHIQNNLSFHKKLAALFRNKLSQS
jgi:hypothetical protein